MHRVCFLLNNDFTRDNRVRREAISLANAGYEVHLFAVKPQGKSKLPIHEDMEGVKIHRIMKRLLRYKVKSDRPIKNFLKIFFRFGHFDVVHAHDANTLYLGHMLARWHRAKLVYDSHEYWESIFDEEAQRVETQKKFTEKRKAEHLADLAYFKAYEKETLAKCDAIISVCDSYCQFLRDKAPADYRHPIVTLRNIYTRTDVPKERKFHEHFGLPPETQVLIYQGAIDEVRGIDYLLDMMAAIPQGDPHHPLAHWVLVLMGPIAESYAQHLNHRMSQYVLKPRVYYKETVPHSEIISWTTSADLGICPVLNWNFTRYYCLPNKLFEYIQAEIPLSASDFPEMKGLIEGHGIGFTFNPEDPQDIAQAITQFAADTHRQHQVAENLKHAKALLNWENEEKRLVGLYHRLMGQNTALGIEGQIFPQQTPTSSPHPSESDPSPVA